ncbi:MAG TPA: transcriptional regulator NrdR [Longimicrobiales bacterium]|nr:transcriptional regulator NrdR [Longimicrobiales bacterium]
MRCPYCHQTEDRVVDTRTSQEGRAVRRRRECLSCGQRFTTHEVVVERQMQVVKRDGSTEPYDRQKLIRSLELPCAKRPVTPDQIEALVDSIEDQAARTSGDQVETRLLGEMVMERLRSLDHVAYVRFASVYRDFQDPDEFAEEVRDLTQREAREAAGRSQVELPLNKP